MTLLQDISNLSSIIFDIIFLVPFFSRRIRKYLFKAMVLDILYEIINDGKELDKQINMLKGIINVYNQMRKDEPNSTPIQKIEKND